MRFFPEDLEDEEQIPVVIRRLHSAPLRHLRSLISNLIIKEYNKIHKNY
jgi:hypothetical protein